MATARDESTPRTPKRSRYGLEGFLILFLTTT
jgi:hypothetical protein